MTNLICQFCDQDLPCTTEDRVTAPYFVDMLIDMHLNRCQAFQGDAGSYRCAFCGDRVSIPERVALALLGSMPEEAVEVLQAEQQLHYSVCEPYLRRAFENGMAAIEAALRQVSS